MDTNTNDLIILKSTIIFYLYTQFKLVNTLIIITAYTLLKFLGQITAKSVAKVYYEDTCIVDFIFGLCDLIIQKKEIAASCLYHFASIIVLIVKLIKKYLSGLEPTTILGTTLPIWTQFISYAIQGLMSLYKVYNELKRLNLI